MNDLFALAAQNTIVALVLALVVYGLARLWRNPPVVHVLWLLVLLKLVAPPLLSLEWTPRLPPESTRADSPIIARAPRIEGQKADPHPGVVDRPADRPTALAPSANEQDLAAAMRPYWDQARTTLFGLWLGGAAVCALVAVRRIVLLERLLRDTLPAPERLQRLTCEIAGKLGIRRVPLVRCVECVEVPFLWCAGRRPTIVLPLRLLGQLDDPRLALILAHELAHLHRRDHWVRGVEMVVAIIYWWNPLVWAIRRQIHQAEDLCCDAWVRWTFPDCTRRYAEVVLQTAESLGASQVAARLLPASPFLHSLSLKARIEMILESRFAPRVSKRSLCAIALVALLVLPSFVETTKAEAEAGSKDEAPVAGAVALQLQDLKAKAIGAKENLESAREKLRFTDRMYRKGYVTKSQLEATTLAVERATLELEVAEGAIAQLQAINKAGELGLAGLAKEDGKPVTGATSEFPHVVKFEQGATRFEGGDQITIEEIRGTADTFAPGNIYWIKGKYKLASHDKAILLASVTVTDWFLVHGRLGVHEDTVRSDHRVRGEPRAGDPGRATGIELKVQRQNIQRGEGTFTLFLPMMTKGMPHVSFYSTKTGEGFGGNYFGTGESVLKKWWGSKETDPEPKGSSAAPSNIENVEGVSQQGESLAGALGLKLSPLKPDDSNPARLGSFRGGLQVTELRAETAAAKSGVRVGDVIVGIGSYETRDFANLALAIKKTGSQPAKLLLRRDGETFSAQIAAGLEP
jgi:beta-lactamase regulating signal transducer with metallopeptidase domain